MTQESYMKSKFSVHKGSFMGTQIIHFRVVLKPGEPWSKAIAAKTKRPTETQIFTIWLFLENVC